MNKQRGFYNIDLTGLFIGLAVLGFVVGIAAVRLFDWAWPYIKAAIHAWTA